MARRTRIRTTGLNELARRLDRFSTSLVREVNIANSSIERMARPFASANEGGPVEFTRIRPGSKSSSVVRGQPLKNADGVVVHEPVGRGTATTTVTNAFRHSEYGRLRQPS